MSRRLGALAVVALVLLAGCSGGVTGDGGPAGDATNTDDLTSAETTETAPALSEQQWADGEERIDFETLREIHADALSNASSYEFATSRSSEDGSSTESSLVVDRDADRVLVTTTVSQGEQEQRQATYVSDGSVYSRSDTDGEFTYNAQNASDEEFEQFVADQSMLGSTGGVADALEWEYVGVEDGQYRFEADSIAESEETSFDADNATTSTGTLVVDETGYVAELSMSLTVETEDSQQSASLSYTTTGVGDTSVEEPEWTEAAADASS